MYVNKVHKSSLGAELFRNTNFCTALMSESTYLILIRQDSQTKNVLDSHYHL